MRITKSRPTGIPRPTVRDSQHNANRAAPRSIRKARRHKGFVAGCPGDGCRTADPRLAPQSPADRAGNHASILDRAGAAPHRRTRLRFPRSQRGRAHHHRQQDVRAAGLRFDQPDRSACAPSHVGSSACRPLARNHRRGRAHGHARTDLAASACARSSRWSCPSGPGRSASVWRSAPRDGALSVTSPREPRRRLRFRDGLCGIEVWP